VENEYRGLDKPMGSVGAKKVNYFRMRKEHLFLQETEEAHVLKRNMKICTCAGTGKRD
jgi:hypothetical protein